MNQSIKELQIIPGIGKNLAQDLHDLGIRKVSDLKTKNPQKLYDKLCDITQSHQDPCVLYTFRAQCTLPGPKIPNPNYSSGGTGKTEKLTKNSLRAASLAFFI